MVTSIQTPSRTARATGQKSHRLVPRRASKPRWWIPESEATPEAVWQDRRRLLRSMGIYGALGATLPALVACGEETSQAAEKESGAIVQDPSLALYPAPRNESYVLDRELTEERLATTYNNFYEFGSNKSIHERAQRLQVRPWEVAIEGLVEKPQVLGIDDLFQKVEFEERLYRHRCVETWAMAVPWTGFPFAQLVALAKPLESARYVKMKTLHDREMMPGQRAIWYPWPYVEGLTLEEATNELAFLATGIYGKPMPKQNGAPLRLVVPWKYGFKSIKSIVSFEFTAERPVSFWEEVQGAEYGFWANVNPEVPHPRWSQARERMLGVEGKRDTLLYNGYGPEVASLYAGLMETEGDRLYR